MGSIITSKPKRGRGSIKVDQDHAKRQRAVQELKNVYQKPISAMVKAPVFMLGAAFAMPQLISLKHPDQAHREHAKKVLRGIRKSFDETWNIDIWKGDHKEGSKSYMQSGEVIKKSKMKEK